MLENEFTAEQLEWYGRIKAMPSDSARLRHIEREFSSHSQRIDAWGLFRRMQFIDMLENGAPQPRNKEKQARKAARWFVNASRR